LNKSRAVGYDDWLQVGMALHTVDPGPGMLEEWDTWSRLCPGKYEDGVCAEKWATFSADGNGRAVTLGSLIHWAEADGWQRPRGPRVPLGGGAEVKDEKPAAAATARPAHEVIGDYLRQRYRPTFRRGVAIYSDALGREVKRAEAVQGAPADLI